MTNIFITSDHHFNHKNIIKLSDRPFNSMEEMNEVMIERWNKIIKKNGIVYHLGDLVFGNDKGILKRLNGKIYLIKGNHDNLKHYQKERFEWVKDYFRLRINNIRIVMFHYPIFSWHGKERGAYHCHGHVHAGDHHSDFKHKLKFNVGVDVNDFYPVSLDEIIK